jgi:hypothetical protein
MTSTLALAACERSGDGGVHAIYAEDDWVPPLPADMPNLANGASRGNVLPNERHRRIGDQLLESAPTNAHPYIVAHYFRSLKQGRALVPDVVDHLGIPVPASELPSYARQWSNSQYWSPLILAFFTETGILDLEGISPLDVAIREDGDDSNWCAAFASWCAFRAGLGIGEFRPSSSAAELGRNPVSIDFRGGAQIEEGDLLVWQDPNGWQGHVGFYAGEEPTELGASRVFPTLGGNQMTTDDTYAVCIKEYEESIGRLRLNKVVRLPGEFSRSEVEALYGGA